MQGGLVVLSYDEAPPTSNRNNGVGGRGHPIAISRTKKKWAEIWGAQLHRVPKGCARVRVTALVEYATKHTRDSDNLYFPLSKPLADQLVAMGIIEDDDPAHYAFERPEIRVGVAGLNSRTKSRVTVRVQYERLQGDRPADQNEGHPTMKETA